MNNLPAGECTGEMVDYIVENHHTYIRKTLPHLLSEIYKIAISHGDKYPFMKRVFILFSQVKFELELNMKREEETIFPFLISLDTSRLYDEEFISSGINMVKEEHEFLVNLMSKIRKVTSDYTISSVDCLAMQLVIASLKSFESNLLIHIELENKFLFDKLNLINPVKLKASA
jgi:regulator of cell morphogenesis and NO signaling